MGTVSPKGGKCDQPVTGTRTSDEGNTECHPHNSVAVIWLGSCSTRRRLILQIVILLEDHIPESNDNHHMTRDE